MSTVREAQQPPYGRRRSNTTQSMFRSTPNVPLMYGDNITLNSWVHDVKDSSNVILNHAYWPGVREGDMLSISAGESRAFLFVVPKDEGCPKPQLQISVPKPIAETFGVRNNSEVTVSKVDQAEYHAEYLELAFQDQYLGRNDMWRLDKHLVNQCVYVGQEIAFIGSITTKIHGIHVRGKRVPAALITPLTKFIYRSLSAKATIFIQVCRELWEFAGDGERFYEKIVHSFLPALFTKWKDAGTNHTAAIVLISRVFYDQSEVEYAAGPLRRDELGRWYKDFYKVITDLEVIHEWKPTLVSLKNSFWDFQRDILLTHHFHRAAQESAQGAAADQVRLVGQLSYAHDGPILEALNLNLYPSETHYIDRPLGLTGVSTIIITPGTGFFRVSKQLLRLTTTRLLDQGFILQVISLARAPLHQTPIFSFESNIPDGKLNKDGPYGSRVMDPLWGCDENGKNSKKTMIWWEPFWVEMSFWDEQMDLPFRQDRFAPRAKMYEIQMLGLLDQDVLPSIEVPFLPTSLTVFDSGAPYQTPPLDFDVLPTKAETDQFDSDTFSLQPMQPEKFIPQPASRNSIVSSSSLSSSLRNITAEKRQHRNSIIAQKIERIEESPSHVIKDLPDDEGSGLPSISVKGLSSSPSNSQGSIRSARSNKSGVSQVAAVASDTKAQSPSRSTLRSKLATSWLFKPFMSGPSEPQTSAVSASVSLGSLSSSSSSSMSSPKSRTTALQGSPRSTLPLTIKNSTAAPSVLTKTFEEESFLTPVGNFNTGSRTAQLRRASPVNTPPRGGDFDSLKRRSGNLPVGFLFSPSSASPTYTRANPTRPQPLVTNTTKHERSGGLASRWEHMYPVPPSLHELKWDALVTPPCLPLTIEYFPKPKELEREYDVFSYDFVVDPTEMKKSFSLNPPAEVKGMSADAIKKAWALVVMKQMAAVRLAQGFQFVIRPTNPINPEPEEPSDVDKSRSPFHRTSSFMTAEDDVTLTPLFKGAAEVLTSTGIPVYLSMSNEIHRISYTGETIQVRRYVRRMPPAQPFQYQCLIWPKLGVGYTEQKITFNSHGLENYGWNRLDMLVAGYEHQFNDSLRYWRTRFIVIPTTESPTTAVGPSGERLNDEEARLVGIEKLAEQFTKLRWQPPQERSNPSQAVRFLPTTLTPVDSLSDEHLMEQLDQIHAVGPLRKKMKSDREIGSMTLMAIAKAMREEDALPIKTHQWHRAQFPDSFTGYDFVSWLVREFRDVSSRTQAVEWGAKLLQQQGLFEHVRGYHGFMDGHYFYRLKGEYGVVSTPRRWFRTRPSEDVVTRSGFYPGSAMRVLSASPRRTRKRVILSQTMVIDIDPNKRSDQAETVLLHHDIIHNPATVFHFELQWIGTTARYIEDQLRQWNKAIEKYDLKLVEAYVGQISDVRDRNPFQSCFPVRLAIPPPIVPDLHRRVPEGTQTARYFEYALLRRFGFIVDVEAADLYPENIDVVYSYRRVPFKYSQFVHRTGVAFVQVLGGNNGFVFLTNRLIGPGRMGTTLLAKNYRPAADAESIRIDLHRFCSNPQALVEFYDAVLAELGNSPEEPPPLSI